MILITGKRYDDGDEALTMRKVAQMNIRATTLPSSSYASGIDRLKRKIKLIGGV
jgi:hypothetical protein